MPEPKQSFMAMRELWKMLLSSQQPIQREKRLRKKKEEGEQTEQR